MSDDFDLSVVHAWLGTPEGEAYLLPLGKLLDAREREKAGRVTPEAASATRRDALGATGWMEEEETAVMDSLGLTDMIWRLAVEKHGK